MAQVSVPTGRRKSLYGATRTEVSSKLVKVLRDIEQGMPSVTDERQTVEKYLTTWIETVRPPRMVEESWVAYDAVIRLHLLPEIGRVRLAQLTPQRVQTLYATCLKKGLSSTRVSLVHTVLHRALKIAVRMGLLQRNMTEMVDAPRPQKTDIHPLSREQVHAYLHEAQPERMRALFILALATGMRIGELLALKWSAIDLDARKVRVNATLKWRHTAEDERVAVWAPPKSAHSRRQIAIAPHVVEALRAHRQAQRLERLAAGEVWQETGAVFANRIGQPMSNQQIRPIHNRILRRANLPAIRVHDLRHTAATLALMQNLNPKGVSEMLGHSTVSITLNIYAHVLPDMLEDAAEAMAVALFG